jgi:hypothetical protein
MESEKFRFILQETKVCLARLIMIFAAFGILGTIGFSIEHLSFSLITGRNLLVCIAIILLFAKKAMQSSVFDPGFRY